MQILQQSENSVNKAEKRKNIENMGIGNYIHELTNGMGSAILFYRCNKFVTNVI